jgi:hypothetical protein
VRPVAVASMTARTPTIAPTSRASLRRRP